MANQNIVESSLQSFSGRELKRVQVVIKNLYNIFFRLQSMMKYEESN